jgi:hypothetical protein
VEGIAHEPCSALPTAKSVAQSNVELFSAERLLNLGIFQIIVGDFGRAWQPFLQNGSAEVKPNGQNSPQWRVFHDSVERPLGDRTGWLGWQDSNLRMAESNPERTRPTEGEVSR